MRHIFWLAREYGQPIGSGVSSIMEWPWTWTRLAMLIRVVESVYERAAVLEAPVPPESIMFNSAEVEQWFKEAKQRGDDDLNQAEL